MHPESCAHLRDSCTRRSGERVVLGLALVLLTHASGCMECDGNRDVTLSVELVDEAGARLTAEELAVAFDAASFEVCVDDGPESRCYTPAVQLFPERTTFDWSHSDLEYMERRRCRYPTVRFSLEIPGCEAGEFVFPGEDSTDQLNLVSRSALLTIVCPGA